MNFSFLYETLVTLLPGVPLTIVLAFLSVAIGTALAVPLALARTSGIAPLEWFARGYIFFFRSTPLLVQIFLIYYGLGQFPAIRHSFLWPVLREPFWCALLALSINTASYTSEIIRGGIQSVSRGQIEAARACGMGTFLLYRRIVLPLAVRQAIPAYGNELILMVKATSLTSIITLTEITGLAARLIAETHRTLEVFLVAGAIYLALIFIITRLVLAFEYWISPHHRPAPLVSVAEQGGTA